jgi:hypothetical protein
MKEKLMKSKQPKGKAPDLAKKQVAGDGRYVDRNLVPVNPLTTQFEPTDASPVPQRYKMAGGA